MEAALVACKTGSHVCNKARSNECASTSSTMKLLMFNHTCSESSLCCARMLLKFALTHRYRHCFIIDGIIVTDLSRSFIGSKKLADQVQNCRMEKNNEYQPRFEEAIALYSGHVDHQRVSAEEDCRLCV